MDYFMDLHEGHEKMNHDHMNHHMKDMDMSDMHSMDHKGYANNMEHINEVKDTDQIMHMNHMHGKNSMMMDMYFTLSSSATVLFEEWHFNTVGGLIGSMVGIFFMAAFYEGLKYFREYLYWKHYNTLQYRAVAVPDKRSSVEDPQVVHMIGDMLPKKPPTIISGIHFLQTFLHMLQVITSYFLMLIFMTYNGWLCIAIILGTGTGYFLFGWKKSPAVDITEHCQ